MSSSVSPFRSSSDAAPAAGGATAASSAASGNSAPPTPADVIVHDFQGLPFSVSACVDRASSALLVAYVNEYMQQVLTYGNRWCVIVHAIRIDPDNVLVNVLMADYLIVHEDFHTAMLYVERAQELCQRGRGNEREQLYARAWGQWMQGKRAVSHTLDTLIAKYPNDLFAIKKAQLIAFLRGDFDKLERVVQRHDVRKACAQRPYYHGMLAFGLEENGRYAEAERAARRGLELCATDPWALHALAHCYFAIGRLAEGVRLLHDHAHVWEQSMSFMYTHAWFHAALFHLDLDDLVRALDVFDQHVWWDEARHGAAVHAPALGELPVAHAHAGAAVVGANANGATVGATVGATASADAVVVASDAGDSMMTTTAGAAGDVGDSTAEVSAAAATATADALGDVVAVVASTRMRATTSRFTYAPIIPPRATSVFLTQDKSRIEDQFGALNLLWRIELRRAGVAASSSTSSASSVLSPSMDIDDELEPRYADLVRHVHWPPASALGLFGIVLLHALCRAGRVEQADEFVRSVEHQVEAMRAAAASASASASANGPEKQRAGAESGESSKSGGEKGGNSGDEDEGDEDDEGDGDDDDDGDENAVIDAGKTADDVDARQLRAQRIERRRQARKHRKHVRVLLPIIRAVRALYGVSGRAAPASASTVQTAYEWLHPIMSVYVHHARKPREEEDVREAKSSSTSSRPPIPFVHIVEVVGGSGEQRGVLTDLWLEVLVRSGHHAEAEHVVRTILADRREANSSASSASSASPLFPYYHRLLHLTQSLSQSSHSHSSHSHSSHHQQHAML